MDRGRPVDGQGREAPLLDPGPARLWRLPDPAGRAFFALLECAAEGVSARKFAEYLSLGQVPDANDDARCKCGQRIDWPHGAVQFAIDLPLVQDVRTGNIEYGLLPVSAANGEEGQNKHQKLERPDCSQWEQGVSAYPD